MAERDNVARELRVERVLLIDASARAFNQRAVVGDDGHIETKRLGNGQRRLEHAPRRDGYDNTCLSRTAHRRNIFR